MLTQNVGCTYEVLFNRSHNDLISRISWHFDVIHPLNKLPDPHRGEAVWEFCLPREAPNSFHFHLLMHCSFWEKKSFAAFHS